MAPFIPSPAPDFGDFYNDAPTVVPKRGMDTAAEPLATEQKRMKRTLKNYPIETKSGAKSKITLPKNSKLLSVGRKGKQAHVTAAIDPDEDQMEERTIRAMSEGDDVDEDSQYLGSVRETPDDPQTNLVHTFCDE